MKLTDGTSSLEISFLEFGRDQRGEPTEARLAAHVESFGFAGANDRVWVFRESFELFSNALRILDRNRQGDAVLESMSPDDLRIRIRAVDGAGHIGVEGWLGHAILGPRQEPVGSKIGFNFELDSSSFSGIVRELLEVVPHATKA